MKDISRMIEALAYILRYCVKGGDQVRISEVMEHIRKYVIQVTDNGPGMTPAHFQQVTREMQEGTWPDQPDESMGFKNLFSRLKLMYGEAARLEITSDWEKGTEARIIFPPKNHYLRKHLERKRMYQVLVIDDEKPVRQAICAFGHWVELGISKVLEAVEGEGGLALLREYQPEIVIVDMKMPNMNGSRFLEIAAREFPRMKYIIVRGESADCGRTVGL